MNKSSWSQSQREARYLSANPAPFSKERNMNDEGGIILFFLFFLVGVPAICSVLKLLGAF